MNEGKIFEKSFSGSFPADIWIYRFKDGTSSWNDNEKCPKCFTPIVKKTRFQLPNICDFHSFYRGNLIYIELKSTASKSFSFSGLRENQQKELTKASLYGGVKAGIVVNFRSVNETYYISIEQYNEIEDLKQAKSIPLKTFREKAILVPQSQKRTNWHYDVRQFLESLTNGAKVL